MLIVENSEVTNKNPVILSLDINDTNILVLFFQLSHTLFPYLSVPPFYLFS